MNAKKQFVESIGEVFKNSPVLRGDLNNKLRLLKFIGKSQGVKTIMFGSGKIEKLEIDESMTDVELPVIEKAVTEALEDARRQIKLAVFHECSKNETRKGETEVFKSIFISEHVDVIQLKKEYEEFVIKNNINHDEERLKEEAHWEEVSKQLKNATQ
jgi:DNA-binding protein YbaB